MSGLESTIIGGCITLFGALIRWRLHGLSKYSPADETVYAIQAKHVAAHGLSGYRRLVREYLAVPAAWDFPSPARFGWIGLCAFGMRCGLQQDPRGVATISAAAGVVTHALMMAIAHALGGQVAMLAAGALGLLSPLSLHLGRRALQDSAVVAATLASIYVELTAQWLLLPALLLLLSLKESALLAWPALIVAALICGLGWHDLLAFALAPVLFAAALAMLAASWRAVPELAKAIAKGQGTNYSKRYQAGPPQRGLVDLATLSPLILVAAALGAYTAPAPAAFAALLLLAHGALPIQNIRFAASADATLRIVVAIWLATLPSMGLAAALPMLLISDWRVFRVVFLIGGVYDTVTYNLLRAQRAIP